MNRRGGVTDFRSVMINDGVGICSVGSLVTQNY
jgi:hypothetical protein